MQVTSEDDTDRRYDSWILLSTTNRGRKYRG